MERNPRFRILIAYENLQAGLRAKEMVDRMAARLGREMEIESDAWSFEALGHLTLRAQAARHASKAGMIIIATRDDGDLPARVKNWIERWLPQRLDKVPALVALSDETGLARSGHAPSPLHAFLSQTADQCGMDFFWRNRVRQSDSVQPPVELLHGGGATSTMIMGGGLDREFGGREWGINE